MPTPNSGHRSSSLVTGCDILSTFKKQGSREQGAGKKGRREEGKKGRREEGKKGRREEDLTKVSSIRSGWCAASGGALKKHS